MSETIEIEEDDWSRELSLSEEEFELVKQASPEYLEKLVKEVPEDTSELAEDYEAPGWALAAFEAFWAAAYSGQTDYAKAIYELCNLNDRRWTFTDVSFDEPQPCPICGTLGYEFRQFTCGHQAYGFIFDEWEDSFPYRVLQSLDDAKLNYDLDDETWDEIQKLPEVALILDHIQTGRLWFQGFPCAAELRCLSARCDIDRFGDVEYLGFHPSPEKFLEQVGKLEEEILKKLSEMGLEIEV
jgi:hypothetical protein